MKTYLAGLVVLLILGGCLVVPAGNMAQYEEAKRQERLSRPLPEEWSGFRGIKWGTKLADMEGMTLVDEQDYLQMYAREGDKPKIGTAELEHIRYLFYRNKFSGIMVTAKRLTNHERLKDALIARFGKPAEENKYSKELMWLNTNVRMILDYNRISEEATWTMVYYPMIEERDADRKKAAESAASDF